VARPAPRIIRRVHGLPGRTRLRLPWLHECPEEAAPLADALAELDPSLEVHIRPWTGSVLCSYDPERLDEDAIVGAVRRHTAVATVLDPGESHPELDDRVETAVADSASSVRRAVTAAFRDLNREVLRASDGRLDLGAVTGLGFLGVGALEIASSRTVPAPPWFNLAWWAFRTFTISGNGPEPDAADVAGAE
jgi:hypothetical protein